MIQYTRVIALSGSYYSKDFIKKKHHKDKSRPIREETVLESFKSYKAEITVYFEEQDKSIHLTPYSPSDEIAKYLGPKFVL